MPRLYGYRWQQSSKLFLKTHPLCAYCAKRGQHTAATVVDHRIPHKGDLTLFWDQNNWQPMCKPCHDSEKQAQETRGYAQGCDVDGWPTDINHPIHGGYVAPHGPPKRRTNGLPKGNAKRAK